MTKVVDAIKNGTRRPAVVLGTGGGKTVVMAHLIPRLPYRTGTKTLVLAHKEELVRQIAQTVRRANPTLQVDVDMRKLKPSADADVIVGSVPTLVRQTRLRWYDPTQFKAVLVDECHHATALSWTKILDHFNALSRDLPVLVVGFTATLERADGASLGRVFDAVAYERNLLTMVNNRELCDARFLTVQLDLDLDQVAVCDGDYVPAQLDQHVNTCDVNLQLARAYATLKRRLGLTATLVFCVSVEHCRTLCAVFQAQGINAQYVSGETVRHERLAILDDFRRGRIDVLCNVLVFTEGTDIPNIDSLVLARPTRSRPLLTQMVGRGLRLHHRKSHCHVIDMVDVTGIGVLSVPLLFGLPATHDVRDKTIRDLSHDKAAIDLEELRRVAEERVRAVRDLLDHARRPTDWDVRLELHGGFAELIRLHLMALALQQGLAKQFARDRNEWVRLEHNVWGTESADSGKFWLVEVGHEDGRSSGRSSSGESELNLGRRIDLDRLLVSDQADVTAVTRKKDACTHADSPECRLYFVTLATRAQIVASNYKCKRKVKLLVNSGRLAYLLGIVQQNSSRWHKRNGPATERQQALVAKTMLGRVRKVFRPGAENAFRQLLQYADQRQVRALLLAWRYSPSCWYVYSTLRGMVERGMAEQSRAGAEGAGQRGAARGSRLGAETGTRAAL